MSKPRRLKRVAFANQKGGVGKTTTAVHTAAAAARDGAGTVAGDLDSQRNLTTTLDAEPGEYTMAEVLRADPHTREVVPGSLAAAIVPAGESWPERLRVVPGSLDLADRDRDSHEGREYRLATASGDGALDGVELAVWDLPPSLGQLTVNGLVAADEVWVVTTPDRYGLEGVAELMATIDRVRRYYNKDLTIGGIVINMYFTGRTESTSRKQELIDTYGLLGSGGLVYPEVCPRMEILTKAAGACAPVWLYGSEGRTAASWYADFAKVVLGGER